MLGALATGVRASAASLVTWQGFNRLQVQTIRLLELLVRFMALSDDLETACFPIGISLAELESRDEHSHSANNCQATDRIAPRL
jgi:hypothetical protein